MYQINYKECKVLGRLKGKNKKVSIRLTIRNVKWDDIKKCKCGGQRIRLTIRNVKF